MSEKSHTYAFDAGEAARSVGVRLVPLAVFAAAMHVGAWRGWLPAPRPMANVDQVVLVHQADRCRRPSGAERVLVGDSSCLMDVSARELAERLGVPAVLNLGTMGYADLAVYAPMLGAYEEANPGRLRTVVVLVHPYSLRMGRATDYYLRLVEAVYAGRDGPAAGTAADRVERALGVTAFRARVLSRRVPAPLPGAYGRMYGFTTDLWRYLDAADGSAMDPHVLDVEGAERYAEFRLSPHWAAAAEQFREALPDGLRVLTGFTPLPEELAPEGFARMRDRLLLQWAEVLGADDILPGLPATLPGSLFAGATHLNARGVRMYTGLAADELRRVTVGEPEQGAKKRH